MLVPETLFTKILIDITFQIQQVVSISVPLGIRITIKIDLKNIPTRLSSAETHTKSLSVFSTPLTFSKLAVRMPPLS